METPGYDTYACPVSKTLTLISGRWKPIILYLIEHHINRYGMMQKKMPGISKKILAEQLRELEADGLIIRDVIVNKAPQEVLYHLTAKGTSLRLLIDQIFEWGTTHMLDESAQRSARSMVLP